MPDVTPLHFPADSITCSAEAAVTGGRFVGVSGARTEGLYTVSHATAAGRALGVAARDKAAGDAVMVFAGPGTIVPVLAAAAITAGTAVEVGADGQATPLAAGIAVGIAMDDAAAGDDVPVRLA